MEQCESGFGCNDVTAMGGRTNERKVGRAGIVKRCRTVSCAVDRHCTEVAAKQGTRADSSPAIAGFEQKIEDESSDGKRKATVAKRVRTIRWRPSSAKKNLRGLISRHRGTVNVQQAAGGQQQNRARPPDLAVKTSPAATKHHREKPPPPRTAAAYLLAMSRVRTVRGAPQKDMKEARAKALAEEEGEVKLI